MVKVDFFARFLRLKNFEKLIFRVTDSKNEDGRNLNVLSQFLKTAKQK